MAYDEKETLQYRKDMLEKARPLIGRRITVTEATAYRITRRTHRVEEVSLVFPPQVRDNIVKGEEITLYLLRGRDGKTLLRPSELHRLRDGDKAGFGRTLEREGHMDVTYELV
ncbi:MAG: hypothetical protein LUC33_05075 [Prevotellaceae bacterium]|nr:hypothetical protein [Prevotellaceae bacterium]